MHREPTFGLAISTLNDGIFRIAALCNAGFDEVIIVHQITQVENLQRYHAEHDKLSASTIKIIVQRETGLSKSRNACIENGVSDYLLLCDDDNALTENLKERLMQAVNPYREAAVLCGIMLRPDRMPAKRYNSQSVDLTLRQAAKVSSCEMVLNRQWVQKHGIRFNTQFGLGATYPGGEEFIFIREVMHAGGSVRFIPEAICILSEGITSGHRYSPVMIRAKGAMIREVYGWKFLFINLAFSLRKYGEYKTDVSLGKFIRYIYSGSFHYN